MAGGASQPSGTSWLTLLLEEEVALPPATALEVCLLWDQDCSTMATDQERCNIMYDYKFTMPMRNYILSSNSGYVHCVFIVHYCVCVCVCVCVYSLSRRAGKERRSEKGKADIEKN